MSDDPSRPPDGDEGPPAPDAGESERAATFSRRALIQAGWTAPVLVVATVPVNAYAQSAHQDSPPHQDHLDHVDSIHSDIPHSDGTT